MKKNLWILKNFRRHFPLKLPCNITEVGKWLGTDPRKKEETDIDVVGLDKETRQAVIGECKFTNSEVDKTIYDDLVAQNNLLDKKYTVIIALQLISSSPESCSKMKSRYSFVDAIVFYLPASFSSKGLFQEPISIRFPSGSAI